MKKIIKTDNAPSAVGAYSQAVEVDGFIFTSGQIPLDKDTGKLVDGDIKSQAKQAMNNLKAVIEGAGLEMKNIIKTMIFITDINDFLDVDAVYKSFFESDFPARSCVSVKDLPKGAKIEVEAIAKR